MLAIHPFIFIAPNSEFILYKIHFFNILFLYVIILLIKNSFPSFGKTNSTTILISLFISNLIHPPTLLTFNQIIFSFNLPFQAIISNRLSYIY